MRRSRSRERQRRGSDDDDGLNDAFGGGSSNFTLPATSLCTNADEHFESFLDDEPRSKRKVGKGQRYEKQPSREGDHAARRYDRDREIRRRNSGRWDNRKSENRIRTPYRRDRVERRHQPYADEFRPKQQRFKGGKGKGKAEARGEGMMGKGKGKGWHLDDRQRPPFAFRNKQASDGASVFSPFVSSPA